MYSESAPIVKKLDEDEAPAKDSQAATAGSEALEMKEEEDGAGEPGMSSLRNHVLVPLLTQLATTSRSLFDRITPRDPDFVNEI